MEQNAKKTGLIVWVVLLLAALGMWLVSLYADLATGLAGAALTSCGLLVALMSYFHMGLEERERFEQLELEEMSKARGSASLFTSTEGDVFQAKRSREQFERFFVPGFTILLFVLQGLAAWWPWKKAVTMLPATSDRATLALALLGLVGLVLFLIGKYASGLARLQKLKLLRPGAAYLLLGAYACFLAAVGICAGLAGFPKVDVLLARAVCVMAGLIAIETLLSLLLEVYRVRVKGRESRALYESRLVGMLGQPEAIFTTAAHALDYQFGFKVSETWFYLFLKRALAWLVLAQFGILILSTCVVFIDPGQEAVLERFGAPVAGREVIGPGVHLKLPWPVDKIRRYRTEQIQTFIVGSIPYDQETILWSIPHSQEDDFLVASRGIESVTETNLSPDKKSPPVNLLAVSIPIHFQITNVVAWAYVNQDPDSLLREVATREVGRYLAGADLENLMTRGRQEATRALRVNIQAEADALQLGAKITFLGLEDIHPPVKVAADYEKVVGAAQTRDAKVLEAQAYAIMTNSLADARAFRISQEAEADYDKATNNAEARAMLFTNQSRAYAAAPEVYEQRAYLQAVVAGSAHARKYIQATGPKDPDVLILNLEDKIRPDLIDQIQVPKDKK